ncbi:hypothetical protein [Actinoplanes subglobosus]|uniref:Uncharacterized protein n=1 Tax=Actinoplanes subglobosus TaxID=1547892 RepID=A0ABV8J675_9ACTN
MTDSDELVGYWEDRLFAYGSMEATDLVLLADGTGWGLWANSGGGQDLVLFDWRRLGPDRIGIAEKLMASGTWDEKRPGQVICDEPPQPADERQEFRYELSIQVPPLGDAPVRTLTLDKAFLFARRFGLARRDVTESECPKVVTA